MVELIDGNPYTGTHGLGGVVRTGTLVPAGETMYEYAGERTIRDEEGTRWYVNASTLKPAFEPGDRVTGVGVGSGMTREGVFEKHVGDGVSVVGLYSVRTETLKHVGTETPVVTETPAVPIPTVRARVLDEAKRITATDRNTSYGEPEDNFQRIADFWNVFLQDKLTPGKQITAGDTAALVILIKLAREMNAPTEDNKIDIAGYAACWAEVDHKNPA